MGGHDQLEQHDAADHQQSVVGGHAPHADGDKKDEFARTWEDSKKSLDFVIAFATNGKGNQSDLPKHVARVGTWGAQVKTLMPDIAKHAKGEIVLECAALLG